MRIETVEKPVERVVERVRYETRKVPVGPTEAVKIVLASPRACRAVLESLTADVESGKLTDGAHTATLRAAVKLLDAMGRRGVLAPLGFGGWRIRRR